MKTADFNYHLPQELIAQTPADPRDSSRLLVLNRADGSITHRTFGEIGDYLATGDILVGNDSRVIPARLRGRRPTGGQIEILLLEKLNATTWKALVGGRRTRPGTQIALWERSGRPAGLRAEILAELDGAHRLVQFDTPIETVWHKIGLTPLPPYITTAIEDEERYQTVYARPEGSAAAPTAGLHFTPDLLLALRANGVLFETVTLHIGLDTFQPVRAAEIADHTIHSEWIRLTAETAERINRAKLAGGRIVAIGTTAARTLETAGWRAAEFNGSLRAVSSLPEPPACPWKPVAAVEGTTDLFIYPGYRFRAVDVLITNFHLPQSSLLMLVAAFAGHELAQAAYAAAIAERYRFYSFGDAMLIL